MFQGPTKRICFKIQSECQWTKSPRHQNSQGTKAEEGDEISSRTWDCELPGEQRTQWKTFFDVWEKWNVSTIRGSAFTTVYKSLKLSNILTDSNVEFCSHTTVQERMHYSTQMSHMERAKHGRLRTVYLHKYLSVVVGQGGEWRGLLHHSARYASDRDTQTPVITKKDKCCS